MDGIEPYTHEDTRLPGALETETTPATNTQKGKAPEFTIGVPKPTASANIAGGSTGNSQSQRAQLSQPMRDSLAAFVLHTATEQVQRSMTEHLPALLQQEINSIDEAFIATHVEPAVTKKMQEFERRMAPLFDTLSNSMTNLTQQDEDAPMSSDEDASGSSSSPSRNKRPNGGPAGTTALRIYLQRTRKVMAKERNRLPVLDTLPACAPSSDVEAYLAGNHPGPTLGPVLLYNWRKSLLTCGWNKAATRLLAADYRHRLKSGLIKHKQVRLQCNEKELSLEQLCKTIPSRLDRTRNHWQDAETRRIRENAPPILSAQRHATARLQARTMRRRQRERKLLTDRMQFIEMHLADILPEDQRDKLIDMLQRLTARGMNTPESDEEDPELIPTEYHWIEPTINVLLDEIDACREQSKCCRLTSRRKKGNRPTPIKACPKRIITDSPATPGLPMNWYRRDWYDGRNPFHRQELKATDEEPLPLLTSLQSAREELFGHHM